MVVGAQVWVVSMDSQWSIVDILGGSMPSNSSGSEEAGDEYKNLYHKGEGIECMDIAEVSKDIVTYSAPILEESNEIMSEIERTLIVYGLRDHGYLNGIDRDVTDKITTQTKGANFKK